MGETPFSDVMNVDGVVVVHQAALCNFPGGSECLECHKHIRAEHKSLHK